MMRVVKVASWSSLPELLEPGVYYVAGIKFTVKEAIPRREVEYVFKEYIARGKYLV